jgi:cytochrome c553
MTETAPGSGKRKRTYPAAGCLLAAMLLVAAPALGESVAKRAETCFACHGKTGQSQMPETPSLGAQPAFFVVAQLFLFREGRRANAPMSAAAKGLSDDDLRAFSELIAKLPPPAPPAQAGDGARAARGRALALEQHCASCHNPDFSGREQMPRLANQREDYLLKAMRDYRSGARIGYGNAAMSEVVAGLGDADLQDLANYLAHLPAGK